MSYFDMSEITQSRLKELEKIDPQILQAKLNPSREGLQQIADLLTFLPEEERVATVRKYIVHMLSTQS